MQLETIAVGDEIDAKRETFFNLLFGKSSGLVCIAIKEQGTRKLQETFFKYPEELSVILRVIAENVENNDVYFCPQLFRERKRVKETVEATPNIWADLDYCRPESLLVEPSLVVESSPDRYQGFWVLSDTFDPDDVENVAQRIAYKHSDDGADRSGWDLTQLLRVPFTYNYKYKEMVIVKPVVANNNRYSLTDFDEHYPAINDFIRLSSVPEFNGDIDNLQSAEEILESRKGQINPHIWKLFSEPPAEGLWSQVLWKLMVQLFESGFSKEEVFSVATESACNKYARDGRPRYQLWKDVCRAEIKVTLSSRLAVVDEVVTGPIDLMTEIERKQVDAAEDTFVERYIKWATPLTDAAPQYHTAGAFVALSSLLSGSVRLPTGFGNIVPNLWFMILADTTLTRKTTAMDIAMEIVEEIDDDILLATDGSIEGLLTVLSSRSNKPSVFLRDEFSGLLDQMVKKDYMAGMAELLTKLYDGKQQKRVLRKEVIEVKAPRLIIFAGGIKNAVTDILTLEHIGSGFLPRFVFITAESDVSRVKPLGPPSEQDNRGKDKIKVELLRLFEWYNRNIEVVLEKTNDVIIQKKFYDCDLTPEAWARYNKLEAELVDFGVSSNRKDIYTPIGDRLAKSILKAAMLIAASRQLNDVVEVSELDVLRAIRYGEDWFTHARAIISRVGMGASEKKLENMLDFIKKRANGVPRSHIMQIFRLNSKEYALAIDTLEQRGHVTKIRAPRGESIRATLPEELGFI